jgi:TusA-related sulfurtransferase
MKILDAKGLSCPEPMLMAKKAMQSDGCESFQIEVDCGASVENISRAARQQGWTVNVLRQDGEEATLELTDRCIKK